jgi:glycyl-tRNA synthetase beta chain
VYGVAEKQADVNEEVKGPSRKIALNDQGGWSKATLGFARSQGVKPEELFFKQTGGVEYVYASKSSAGIDTAVVLQEGLSALITSMIFPKNMRWGSHELRFVRPIRWLIALFGSHVVPLEVAGVKSSNVTRGHRFLGMETLVEEPSQYADKLRAQYVIADVAEREKMIVEQIAAFAKEHNWKIVIKDDLLEEVLFLVEYPSVLSGSFDPDFLNIPQDALIMSMREHQRYFPVFNVEEELQPYFITVRNGDRTAIDQVSKGNEKVLRARLSDAKFFYEEDQKLTITAAQEKLNRIVYHEELGTVADKVNRIQGIADQIASYLQVDKGIAQDVSRAAGICKFDLVTQMVYEFPELQGIMGEDYARKAGESEAVAKAVVEHYLPRFAGDRTPATLPGAIVGIADKIDTIAGCFSIGIVPTGSQDPYALRRQASGIVQIILTLGLKLPLNELFDMAINIHARQGRKRTSEEIRKSFYDFFALRVKYIMAEQGIRYDVIDAVMALEFNDIALTVQRAGVIQSFAVGEHNKEFKSVVDAFNRVSQLSIKAVSRHVDTGKFKSETEWELYSHWQTVHDLFEKDMSDGNVTEALERLATLKPIINRYFEAVMVMAEDSEIRENRLATLAVICDDISQVVDFSKLAL